MRTKLPLAPNGASTADCSGFALGNLLLMMPYIPLTEGAEIDYAAADPAALAQLADAADASLLIIHLGTTAIGRLLARTATEPFNELDDADAVEALGWLVAELGDLARIAQTISATCRRNTYGCTRASITPLALAKP